MPDFLERVRKAVEDQDLLTEGEEVLAAIEVTRRDDHPGPDERTRVADVDWPRSARTTLALTDDRLMFLRVDRSDQPAQVVHVQALGSIEDVTSDQLDAGGVRTIDLTLTLDDGSILPAEAVVDSRDGDEFDRFLGLLEQRLAN